MRSYGFDQFGPRDCHKLVELPTPERDAACVATAVGDAVTRCKVGDRVGARVARVTAYRD